jgi:DNA polymerase III sliding clamp (beta) subunit (PCNA family)
VTNVDADIQGDMNDMVLNYRYVIDALSHVASPRVRFSIVDQTTPVIIRPEKQQTDSDSYVHIIMPIKQ